MSLLQSLLIFCAISLCSLAKGNESFPIVDKAAQQARDLDRHRILETEFATEQQALGAALEAMAKAPTDDTRTAVRRHEENVKALQRELEHLQTEKPVRVSARAVGAEPAVVSKRTTSVPVRAPFWDVYRRGAPPTDFQPSAKEVP
jgi:hypothetical protein